ncbi:class I SAM-dependent methyltransferase [Nocardioides conyzicola]|uniref:Methyltransferase domain-containing protein n=1 Tax=Nocardioides conyzicola TaxID=1651781 RepID=A0ABP8XVU5_9ACTN
MHALLRRRPDTTSDYTTSHLGRGSDYDDGFAEMPMRALMWELEQAVLRDLVTMTGARTVLDLACGTGRITELLVSTMPGSDIVGVDVADSMLAVARERVPSADFRQVDVRALSTVVDDGSVDLVSAFRFFPNADPALRHDAVDAIAAALRPGGYLLVNNHRNFWSSSYLGRRARSGVEAPGATNAEVVGPLLDLGFTPVARHSLGVLPQADDRAYGVSTTTASRIERFNARRLSSRHTAGTNTIWLLQRDPGRSR